jgi:hypothetical protein
MWWLVWSLLKYLSFKESIQKKLLTSSLCSSLGIIFNNQHQCIFGASVAIKSSVIT